MSGNGNAIDDMPNPSYAMISAWFIEKGSGLDTLMKGDDKKTRRQVALAVTLV